MKMKTGILGGSPAPSYPGDKPREDHKTLQCTKWEKNMEYYAKYILALFVPWDVNCQTLFPFSVSGLCMMLREWDCSSAPLLHRQRVRYILNFMNIGHRSHKNEMMLSLWRDRNADRWCDMKNNMLRQKQHDCNQISKENYYDRFDGEASGALPSEELAALASSILERSQEKENINSFANKLRTMCSELHEHSLSNKEKHGVEELHFQCQGSLVLQHYVTNHAIDIEETNHTHLTIKEILHEITSMETTTTSVVENEQQQAKHVSSVTKGINDPEFKTEELNLNMDCTGMVKLTAQQKDVLTAMLECTRKQKLMLLHSGGGTGKSMIVKQLNYHLTSMGFHQANTCPTGVGASQLPNGRTFHSLFKTAVPNLNAGRQIDEIRQQLHGSSLKVVVVDEVSMLPSTFLCLLDSRLRSIYNPNDLFGGISILLLGDFVQLPVTAGRSLFQVMYGVVTTNDAKARALFSNFQVVELDQQMRAGNCAVQQGRLKQFRQLPNEYPEGSRWTTMHDRYQPMNADIVHAITTELTKEDIIHDPNWSIKSTCLTTSNFDRSIINASTAKIYGMKQQTIVLRWKRQLKRELPIAIKELLYNEDIHPELFGYFVQGGRAQILDNGNGNVSFGVANGTPCTMVAVAWNDVDEQFNMTEFIANACHQNNVIDIPKPPDFIIVEVNVQDHTAWPHHLNLSKDKTKLHIPIGLFQPWSSESKHSIKLNNGSRIEYHTHAVDLSFAITTWKSQGATLDYVIACLERSPQSPALTFEMLYVMFSRVKVAGHFRCMPLSPDFKVSSLKRLRPNIMAVKWRMDIGKDGYWKRRDSLKRAQYIKSVPNHKKPSLRSRKITPDLSLTSTNTSATDPSQSKTNTHNSVTVPNHKKRTLRSSNNMTVLNHNKRILRSSNKSAAQSLSESKVDGNRNNDWLHDKENEWESSTYWLRTCMVLPERSIGIRTGLPIQRHGTGFVFYAHRIEQLKPTLMLKDDIMDLFAMLDCEPHQDVHYIDTAIFGMFRDAVFRHEDCHSLLLRLFRNPSKLHAMVNANIWVTFINQNLHWQTLIVLFPCRLNCVALLMDPLISSAHTKSDNFIFVQNFTRSILQVTSILNNAPPISYTDILIQCLVPNQPNGFDCGPFSLLNLRQTLCRKHDLLSLCTPSLSDCHEIQTMFLHCYLPSDAVKYRKYLLWKYSNLITLYS